MEKWPIVTFMLIFINLAVFLFTYDISSNQVFYSVVEDFGLVPQSLSLRIYTLITHMFLHADIIHFIGNMLMLSIVGIATEHRIGSLEFLLFYLFSGLCVIPFAFLMEYILAESFILIGASGAIFGVMFLAGAIAGWEEVPAILIPILNILAIPYIMFSLKNFKVPLFVAIVFYFLLNLLLMFYNLPYSISEVAHFGGIFGGIVAFSMIPSKEEKKD